MRPQLDDNQDVHPTAPRQGGEPGDELLDEPAETAPVVPLAGVLAGDPATVLERLRGGL